MNFRRGLAFLKAFCFSTICTRHAKGGSIRIPENSGGNSNLERNIFFNDQDVHRYAPARCVLHLIYYSMVDESLEEESKTVCIMDPEYEGDGIKGIAYELDMKTLPQAFEKDVKYGETVVTISAAEKKNALGKHSGGSLSIAPFAAVNMEEIPESDSGQGIRGKVNDIRPLAPTKGTSSVLVLYAVPPDASNRRSSVEMANDIFGISSGNEPSDPINARSQFMECSRGQLSLIPACSNSDSECFGNTDIVNGVLEVPIDTPVTGVRSNIVANIVQAAAQEILTPQGVDMFSFTHIMVIIPSVADWGSAAAWASVPGYLSAYRGTQAYNMGIQTHELGHNLGFRHSGFEGRSYDDGSCLMGTPSFGDDGPKVCWNGAKSWESAWYAADSVSVDPEQGFSTVLIGVADWVAEKYTPGTHKVVLEIKDSSMGPNLYVMYNRKKGPNNGVRFAPDRVTITQGGSGYTSWHQGSLGPPDINANDFQVFRKSGYNGGEKDLVVKVCNMEMGSSDFPDTAHVLVYLDDGPGFNNGLMCPGEKNCVSNHDCNDGDLCVVNRCDLNTNTCLPPEPICDDDNFALSKAASQSSTVFDGVASRAVDGDRNGDFRKGSVTNTDNDDCSWWMVDLGDTIDVNVVKMFNRDDCCPSRLSNFVVEVLSDSDDIVSDFYYSGEAGKKAEVGFGKGTFGRYVRVKKGCGIGSPSEDNVLSFAEVEVYTTSITIPEICGNGICDADESCGTCNEDCRCAENNIALLKNAVQSSTNYGGDASRAVDGNTSGFWQDNSVTHTNRIDDDACSWWKVDLESNVDVSLVNIYNRQDCCSDRLSDFTVEVRDANDELVSEVKHDGATGYLSHVGFERGTYGRYVTIMNGCGQSLSLAEVEVFSNIVLDEPTSRPSSRPTGRPTTEPSPTPSAVPTEMPSIPPSDITAPEICGNGICDADESCGTCSEDCRCAENNIALLKNAVQSSTNYGGDASRAVDGNTSGFWQGGSVTHTNYRTDDGCSWWKVDLESNVDVSLVNIYNRQDCCSDRLSDFTVEVRDANDELVSEVKHDGTTGYLTHVGFERGTYGRYVTIVNGCGQSLSLAEVEVFSSIVLDEPTSRPSSRPTGRPTVAPSVPPSTSPSIWSSASPSAFPTMVPPTLSPTKRGCHTSCYSDSNTLPWVTGSAERRTKCDLDECQSCIECSICTVGCYTLEIESGKCNWLSCAGCTDCISSSG